MKPLLLGTLTIEKMALFFHGAAECTGVKKQNLYRQSVIKMFNTPKAYVHYVSNLLV